MIVLTLSVSLPGLKPPTCKDINSQDCKEASTLQLGIFFAALYTLAVVLGSALFHLPVVGGIGSFWPVPPTPIPLVSQKRIMKSSISFFNLLPHQTYHPFNGLRLAIYHIFNYQSFTTCAEYPLQVVKILLNHLMIGTIEDPGASPNKQNHKECFERCLHNLLLWLKPELYS